MQGGKGYCLRLAVKIKFYFKLVLSEKEFYICWLELSAQAKGGGCCMGRRRRIILLSLA